MIPFTYLQPPNLDEALALLAQHGDEAKLIAGGTGLVNFMKQRLVRPSFVIGLRGLKCLVQVEEAGALRIGALTTLQSLATCDPVRRCAPLLAEASGTGWKWRHRGCACRTRRRSDGAGTRQCGRSDAVWQSGR